MKSILVIDDEEAIRDLLKLALENDGYQVYKASDGREGLAKYKEYNPEIVLTDIKMPHLSGIELIKAIKSINKDNDVVMMTGYGTEDTVIEALRAGASNYIKKPVAFDELFGILDNIILKRENRKRYEIIKDVVVAETKKIVIDNNITRIWGIVNQILFNVAPLFSDKIFEGMSIGLYEIIINAIEHGNLGISYKEKTLDLHNNSYLKLIIEKSDLANKEGKRAYINYELNRKEIIIEVIDQGDGFNFKEFNNINNPETLMDIHGRGIFLASIYFDKIEYKEPGNRVILTKKI